MKLWMDQVEYELRRQEDFSWLKKYGECFAVYDRLTSGNICFGLEGLYGRLFVKYAGAQTVNYSGRVQDAVDVLQNAAALYETEHQSLTRLLNHGPVNGGYALIFQFEEGQNLHEPGCMAIVRRQSIIRRLHMLDGVIDLQVQLEKKGLMAVDLSCDNLIADLDMGRLIQCDIDLYTPFPRTNEAGRMPGLPRYLSPEEYRQGAVLDARTTVYKLGMLILDLLRDGEGYGEMQHSPAMVRVVQRALSENAKERFPSAEEFQLNWRQAVGKLRSW